MSFVLKGNAYFFCLVCASMTAEDATFEMERRRNRPEKYDRELVQKTIKAIERIDEIRTRRQERFYEKRMARVKGQQVAADKQQLEQEIHLVKAPASLRKQQQDQPKEKLKIAVEDKPQEETMQD
jgi:large subunit ribosomal protein L24e